MDMLCDLKFDIKYRSGSSNGNADAPSRQAREFDLDPQGKGVGVRHPDQPYSLKWTIPIDDLS